MANPRDGIVVFALTPANVDERLVVRDWFGLITGLLIGDKGFISKDLDEECDDHAIDLRTPLKRNTAAQGGSQPIDARKARVETTIGQLARKILACNMSLSFKQS